MYFFFLIDSKTECNTVCVQSGLLCNTDCWAELTEENISVIVWASNAHICIHFFECARSRGRNFLLEKESVWVCCRWMQGGPKRLKIFWRTHRAEKEKAAPAAAVHCTHAGEKSRHICHTQQLHAQYHDESQFYFMFCSPCTKFLCFMTLNLNEILRSPLYFFIFLNMFC